MLCGGLWFSRKAVDTVEKNLTEYEQLGGIGLIAKGRIDTLTLCCTNSSVLVTNLFFVAVCMFSLFSLPFADVLYVIFSYLTPVAISRLAQVNHR